MDSFGNNQEPNMKVRIILSILAVLLVAASAGTAFYFFKKYQSAQYLLNNPEKVAQDEVKSVTSKLSALMELPGDEQPSVATVLEKDKLKDQPFFAKAENGDKVIIYTKAMKAILYRISSNKIIEVMPISITQPEGSNTNGSISKTDTKKVAPSPSPLPSPSPKE
jgi:hypothetical protein